MPFDDLFAAGKPSSGQATTAPTTTAPPATTTAPPPTAVSGVMGNAPQNVANFVSGLEQGIVRDPISTFIPVGRWLEQNIPGVRWLDERANMTPEALEAQNQAYQASPAAGSLWGMGGRLGGNVVAGSAIPLPGAGTISSVVGDAPIVAGAIRGALAGGAGSALTSGGYGDNPLTAGAEGAVGGGAIGGLTGALVRPVQSFLTSTADRLGIDLSAGQSRGGILTRLEDLSGPIPGGGADKLAKTQNQQMVNVLQRNMGVPETGSLDLPSVQVARRAAGQDMGNVAGTMSVDGTAQVPSGVAGGAPLSLSDRLDQIYDQANTTGTAAAPTEAARAADTLRTQINASIANGGGSMPGSDLKTFLATGNTLDRLADHSNTEVQKVAAEVRSALFNAVDNTPTNPPDVLKDFQAARLRYKAALTSAEAIGKAGSSEAMTPAGLKQAIQRNYMDPLMGGATGPGYDMPDLARLIQAIPKLASSGTAERQTLYNAILGAGTAATAGGLGYLASPNALSAGLTAAAPLAALSAAGRISRFGAGAVPGGNAIAPYIQAVNPLLPRLLGQGVGNLLTTGNMPRPGGGQ